MTAAKKNAVWIELERPDGDAHAQVICGLANNMLARLREDAQDPNRFTWNERRKLFEYGSPMGTKVLTDNGNWFSLDFMGRPLD